MGPSAYHAELAKDQVVEDRDGVKVVFAGGNVFHLHVEGVEAAEVRRGVNKAWERAEAIRKQLNPDYVTPEDPVDGQPAASEGGETAGEPSAKTGDEAPADNPPPSDADNPPTDEKPDGESSEGQQEQHAENPPTPDEPKQFDEPEADPKEGDESEDGGEEVQQPATGDGTFSIGGIEAPLRLVPVSMVFDVLGASQGRVHALQQQAETRRLCRRVRATDGRCAPIFFTQAIGEDAIHLFSGIRTLAAAMNLGMEAVAVVILPADKAQSVQGAITALHRAALSPTGDEEEMLYRAHNA